LATCRRFFGKAGFVEVSTPTIVTCPAAEARLHAIPAGERYLRTSPEIHLKRLLADGMERIFEIGPAFRQEEVGVRHLEEFTILEWYRAFAPLGQIIKDCEALVAGACRTLGRHNLALPIERKTWRQAFRDVVGVDPFEARPTETLRQALRAEAEKAGLVLGTEPVFEDLCEGLFVAVVEPTLKTYEALILTDFPAWTAALARIQKRGPVEVADRFELYLGGTEIANAYHELNDPAANRARLESCNRLRTQAGRRAYPPDEKFFNDLEKGMPPASGAALGVDRLLMWLLDTPDIHYTTPFKT